MRRTVGVAFQSDGGNRDNRSLGEPSLQVRVAGLSIGKAEPPSIIMDHDADVIRVIERGGASGKDRIIEMPLRRGDLPNEPRKVVAIFLVTQSAPFGGEVELVPPLELRFRRQRQLAHFLAADEIPTYGDESFAALGP